MTHKQKRSMIWTLAITSAALFMVSLDNLVVTTALPVIRRQLHASISQLEWTVNAYTLTFAVLLLTGAALGDRFGRRRLFVLGLLLFTGASAAAALATSANALDIARAVQGVGGAIVTPLTLTILSAAVPPARRGLALGIWGGVGGLAIALGPLVGGAIVDGISWHWIFWLNVPIGLVLAPLALSRLEATRGVDSSLDLPGLALASSGLLGIVWGLVRGNTHGWTSLGIVGPIVGGLLLLAAFVAWELRTESPMLPMEFFRSRTFALTNVASLLMFFGMFGSIFLLAQFFQTVQHYSPLASGLRILPWTAMPIFVAPVAGALSDRIGGQRLMAAGLALQAAGLLWIAAVSTPTTPYVDLVVPFALSGFGMALFFAPVANVVLSSVRPEQEGKASGVTNAIRELGGVFGVAVLASIFAHVGGYQSGTAFVHGTTTAVYVGGAFVALGAAAAALIPGRLRLGEAEALVPELEAAG
ncbi:MAG: DHA2 family efflux MFS transporter permease subunit [Gaiellaceae bacterium]